MQQIISTYRVFLGEVGAGAGDGAIISLCWTLFMLGSIRVGSVFFCGCLGICIFIIRQVGERAILFVKKEKQAKQAIAGLCQGRGAVWEVGGSNNLCNLVRSTIAEIRNQNRELGQLQ